jgi:hypothetical protein
VYFKKGSEERKFIRCLSSFSPPAPVAHRFSGVALGFSVHSRKIGHKIFPILQSNEFNIYYSWMTSRNPLGFFSNPMDHVLRSNRIFFRVRDDEKSPERRVANSGIVGDEGGKRKMRFKSYGNFS